MHRLFRRFNLRNSIKSETVGIIGEFHLQAHNPRPRRSGSPCVLGNIITQQSILMQCLTQHCIHSICGKAFIAVFKPDDRTVFLRQDRLLQKCIYTFFTVSHRFFRHRGAACKHPCTQYNQNPFERCQAHADTSFSAQCGK